MSRPVICTNRGKCPTLHTLSLRTLSLSLSLSLSDYMICPSHASSITTDTHTFRVSDIQSRLLQVTTPTQIHRVFRAIKGEGEREADNNGVAKMSELSPPNADLFYTPTKTMTATLPASFLSPGTSSASSKKKKKTNVHADKAYLDGHLRDFRMRQHQQHAKEGGGDDVQWKLACTSATRNLSELKSLISSIVSTSDNSFMEPLSPRPRRAAAAPRHRPVTGPIVPDPGSVVTSYASWQSFKSSRERQASVGTGDVKASADDGAATMRISPGGTHGLPRGNPVRLGTNVGDEDENGKARARLVSKPADEEGCKNPEAMVSLRDEDEYSSSMQEVLRRSLVSDVNTCIGKIKTVGETRCESEIFDILMRIKDRLDASDSRSRSTRVNGYNDGSRDDFCDAKEEFVGGGIHDDDEEDDDESSKARAELGVVDVNGDLVIKKVEDIDDDADHGGVRENAVIHENSVAEVDDEDEDEDEDFYDTNAAPCTKISFSSFIQDADAHSNQDSVDDNSIDETRIGNSESDEANVDETISGVDNDDDGSSGAESCGDGGGKTNAKSVSFDAFDNALAAAPSGPEAEEVSSVGVDARNEASVTPSAASILFQIPETAGLDLRSPPVTRGRSQSASTAAAVSSSRAEEQVGGRRRAASVNVLGETLEEDDVVMMHRTPPILAIPEDIETEANDVHGNPAFQEPVSAVTMSEPHRASGDAGGIGGRNASMVPTQSSPSASESSPTTLTRSGVGRRSPINGVPVMPPPSGTPAGNEGILAQSPSRHPQRDENEEVKNPSIIRQAAGIGSSRSSPMPEPSPPPPSMAPAGVTSPRRTSVTRSPSQQQQQQQQQLPVPPRQKESRGDGNTSPTSSPLPRSEATSSEDREKLKNLLFQTSEPEPEPEPQPQRSGGFFGRKRSQSTTAGGVASRSSKPSKPAAKQSTPSRRRATVSTVETFPASNGIFDGPSLHRHDSDFGSVSQPQEQPEQQQQQPRRIFALGGRSSRTKE